jgi:hypothetical protein
MDKQQATAAAKELMAAAARLISRANTIRREAGVKG